MYSKDKIVNVITNCDKNYIMLASVWLFSLAECSNPNTTYNIIIMSSDMNDNDLTLLRKVLTGYDNCHISIYNVADILEKQLFDKTWNKSTIVYYSNLFIAEFFSDMDRCLYLDVDMIIKSNIEKLYDLALPKGKYIAAVSAYGTRGKPNTKDSDYITNELGLSRDEDYFNNGTMLLDIKGIREAGFLSRSKILSIVKRKLRFADQDAMNILMKEKVLFLDPKWNVGAVKNYQDIDEKYKAACEKPAIIHFNGPQKPIDNPNIIHAEEFWKVARKTPIYESLILYMMKKNTNSFSSEISIKKMIKGNMERVLLKLRKF